MGSAAAYRLAERGQRVLGLEKFKPVHTWGSSHGGSRITRQAYFEDPAYVPLLLRAHEMWGRIEADSGRQGLPRGGGGIGGGGSWWAGPSRARSPAACGPRGSGTCRTNCSTPPRSAVGSRPCGRPTT